MHSICIIILRFNKVTSLFKMLAKKYSPTWFARYSLQCYNPRDAAFIQVVFRPIRGVTASRISLWSLDSRNKTTVDLTAQLSATVHFKNHFDLTVPIFSGISMIVKCDSDITVFILNFSITSTFCLRRECTSLKPTVLLILALCDWCAVFFGTFARLANVWMFPFCICEQPQVLLQTGKYDIYFHFQLIW